MVNTSVTGGSANVMAMRVVTTSSVPLLGTANDPLADPIADWMLFEPFTLTGTGNDNYSVDRRVIDVKSARRLEEVGQTVLLSFGGGSVDQQQVSGVLSLGLKLP